MARRPGWPVGLKGAVAASTELDALVDELNAPSKARRREAADRLASAAAGPGGDGRLRAALDDERPGCRWGAAFALDRAGLADLRVVQVAVETLGDRDADLRWAAARLLCRAAGGLAGVEALLLEAAADVSEQRAKMAIYCLRDLGSGTTELYRHALLREETGVRFAALSALASRERLEADDLRAMEQAASSDAHDGVRRAARTLLDKHLRRG